MTLADLLDELRIPYRTHGYSHHVSEGWVGTDCSRCSPHSNKFHLGINERSLATHCWTCGHCRLGDMLAEASGRSIREVLPLLQRLRRQYEPQSVLSQPKGRLALPKGLNALSEAHKHYLTKRGYTWQELERLWGLKGISIAPRLQWRVWIPIQHRGRTVSWTTRSVSDAVTTRYISARPDEEEIPHRQLLFGADYCRHAAIITEGPFDAMRIGPGAVATFGISVTRKQTALLSKYPLRVVCFDSEPKAQRAAMVLFALLGTFPGRTVRVELNAADPGSASKREIDKLREEFLR